VAGWDMRKLIAGIVLASLLLLAPSTLAAPARAGGTATASAGFVRIGGALRLPARQTLRVPLRCTVTCIIRTRTVLVLPGPDLGPLVSSTVLRPAFPKDLVLTLNGPATRILRSNIATARLKVRAHAVDMATGAVADAFKVFRFKR
jgi:hypothetical protein